ncbi:Putative colanic biosynthesis UDP-glucose lipid carrier transferase [Aerococcus viridans]|nr:Putative colanic biosynthesis UDP-glucose lipid carrier transferase [Aerococcus viridans]
MYRYFIKRFLDIVFSLLLLPFFVIILVPLAIAIKLDDKGSVFYLSNRLGKNMKEFKMFKFRSMKENAPDLRNSDGTTYNSKDDPRVTRVGKILRKTSIDEIPQIINVFLGHMSFVGPRPSPLGDKSIYPEDFFLKFKVKPGITGYSQAKVRNNASMIERIQLDKHYVHNFSFILDCKIILWTIFSVLKSRDINRN